MKEMVYSDKQTREVLIGGCYKGYAYKIISMGTHPCAYISLPKDHKLYGKEPDSNGYPVIVCNGGITYCDTYLMIDNNTQVKGWWIGWDYAHCWDYHGIVNKEIPNANARKHTTAEILTEIYGVIEQLEEHR